MTQRYLRWYHSAMVRRRRLLQTARQRPAGLKFRQLCALAEAVGFVLDRQAGSHQIYLHPHRRDVPRLSLQEGPSGDAKPYQVRLLLQIIDDFDLEVSE